MATWRPLLLAGMSSDTHRGVVAVLKPFPQPLGTSFQSRDYAQNKLLAALPDNATNDHLRHAERRCLQCCPDEHEGSSDLHALLAPQHLPHEEHSDCSAETSYSASSYVNGLSQLIDGNPNSYIALIVPKRPEDG